MYRLATKRITKNEVRKAISVYGRRLLAGIRVEDARLVCQQCHVPWTVQQTCAYCGCVRRSAVIVGSADWQRTGFLFRGRDSRCCDQNE